MKTKILKVLSIFLVITIMMSFSTLTYANDNYKDTQNIFESISEEEITNISKNIIGDLKNAYTIIYAPNSKDKTDALKDFNKKTYTLINCKAELQRMLDINYGTQKINYFIDVYELEHIIFKNNNIVFKYKIIERFNYKDVDFDTEVGEITFVSYDTTNNIIVDIYTPTNFFDVDTRNAEIKDICDFDKLGTVDVNIILDKTKELKNDINTEYNSFLSYEQNSANNEKQILTESNKLANLNHTNTINYALTNCSKKKPARGKSTVPYYDFSTISGSYDCTNFVSHALLAGGAKIYDTGNSGISSSGWYFRNINNRSSSWSGVPNLYNYMVNNRKENTLGGIGSIYSLNPSTWGIGQILQFKPKNYSVYRHSTIITQKKYSNDHQRAYAYVTGRSGVDMYNKNQAASEMYVGGSKRTIFPFNN